MVLENVPRIDAPSAAVLMRDWIRPGRPVILQNLFDAAPLRAVDSLEAASRIIGDVELEIQPNYLTFLETGQRGQRRRMALARYLEQVAVEPNTRDLCVEFATPDALAMLLPRPACAELLAPDDVVSATFLANAGNYNHLHYDDDQRTVLLYQVFGRKRFSLISPAAGRKLDAFLVFDATTRAAVAQIPARDANGRVYLHTFPDQAAQDAFLRYAGASDCVLGPGETLLMPALFWHYVEYCETSLSVTYRLGRNPLNRALNQVFPAPTLIAQEVGYQLSDAERFEREQPALRAELEQVMTASYADVAARRAAFERFLNKAFAATRGASAEAVLEARELYRRALAG